MTVVRVGKSKMPDVRCSMLDSQCWKRGGQTFVAILRKNGYNAINGGKAGLTS